MGRVHVHPRSSRHFIDSRTKNDVKLLKHIKQFPIIYDKSHRFHRDSAELEKVWKYIAKCLHKTVQKCKERWHALLQEFSHRTSEITSHDVIFELLSECFRRFSNITRNSSYDIEEDILSQLFLESVENETPSSINIGYSPQDASNFQLPNQSMFSFFSDSGYDLQDEARLLDIPRSLVCEDARSLPPPEYFFHGLPVGDSSADDLCYKEGRNADEYYFHFVENIQGELDRCPFLFGEVVNSLVEQIDEEVCAEVCKDIVRMLCDKLKERDTLSRQ